VFIYKFQIQHSRIIYQILKFHERAYHGSKFSAKRSVA